MLPALTRDGVYEPDQGEKDKGINELKDDGRQEQEELHKKMRSDAAVHYVPVRGHGGEDICDALYAALIGVAEKVAVIVRDEIRPQIAHEHHKKNAEAHCSDGDAGAVDSIKNSGFVHRRLQWKIYIT